MKVMVKGRAMEDGVGIFANFVSREACSYLLYTPW
jgi:hypothetical protein